jgi:hypothetical protein
MPSTPCTCSKHMSGAPIELYGHRYELACDAVERQDFFLQRWRYVCSCGSRGKWTFQSANVPYHSWLGHIRRAQAQQHLRQIEEMYS